MSVQNTRPPQAAGRDDGYFRDDSNQGGWSDTDGFVIGGGGGQQVLALSGFADAEIDVGLQAAVPNDYASIRVFLGNAVNLNGFADVSASGTVTSAASSQGSLTLTNGNLSGACSATLSIDVTAYIAAEQATVHMHITDSFEMSLTGRGYAGLSLAETAGSGSSVQVIAPPANNAVNEKGGSFDLARFAASVLNTGQWKIAFVASAPGESLQGRGESILTISATADLPGHGRPETLRFQDTEQSHLAFSDSSTPMPGMHPGFQETTSGPVSLFHNV